MPIVMTNFTCSFRKRKIDSLLADADSYNCHSTDSASQHKPDQRFLKVCAKFTSGIRWGIGAIMERTCSVNCRNCNNTSACRIFEFRRHYEVAFQPRDFVPEEKV